LTKTLAVPGQAILADSPPGTRIYAICRKAGSNMHSGRGLLPLRLGRFFNFGSRNSDPANEFAKAKIKAMTSGYLEIKRLGS